MARGELLSGWSRRAGGGILLFILLLVCGLMNCGRRPVDKIPAVGLVLSIECSEAALRAALDSVAAIGGGTITFECNGDTLDISDRIYFYGSKLVLDGGGSGLVVRYTGPDDCSQTEGQDHFIEIHGDSNVVRNFTLLRFPDGMHVQSGYDNLVENLRFPGVCEDAVTNNGRGYEAYRTVIRGCYFEDSEDKAVMINNGGSVTVEDCEFVDCQQPVRAGGSSGYYVVRGCTFSGRSTGPRFSGGRDTMNVIFENNTIHDSEYGIRVYGEVQAIIRNNVMRPGNYGIYAYENARVRLERNDIQNASSAGVLLKDHVQADLGGGSVSIDSNSQASLGLNILRGNQSKDLLNLTADTVKAMNNVWDHATVAEVLAGDVSGPVEVEPLGTSGGPAGSAERNLNDR
ncbi:MAG: right-handed parallel beta-helix repeat-containing protein [Fidelibacterota bacterium]|nr:MAG: right-handed parallel beta-helix repeat-containing protein [Candidatus Neomarinimicrobiota bacterium]